MITTPITEETLTDLSILREKIKVALDCIVDNANAREQVLAYIAGDYLGTMREMIQSMEVSVMQAHE